MSKAWMISGGKLKGTRMIFLPSSRACNASSSQTWIMCMKAKEACMMSCRRMDLSAL